MINKYSMSDIYNDFFSKPLIEKEENNDNLNELDIDSLYLDEKSKDILKKIVEYMKLYSEKKLLNYINFNILLESKDKKTIDKVIDIIKSASFKYKYVNENIKKIPIYKLEKTDDIYNIYRNNPGIVVFENLNNINMQDNNFKTKLMYTIKENIDNHINILVGEKAEINEFFISDIDIKNNYFIFELKSISPDINDIYNLVLNKVDNLDDDKKIKLLDYITHTYHNNIDYDIYLNTLCNELLFSGNIPTYENEKTIEEVFSELEQLVGLKKVKKTFYDLVDLISFKNKAKDLKINNINLHMVFLGNPGTGKTTVARMISEILYNLKYIKENKLIEVSAKDLIAEYVGQTAPKTMSVIDKALGGVLFIDEAYILKTNNNDNSFNGEAIATLIKCMEDYRDNLVVIFAGYTKEMKDFLDSNSGILSRIGYTLEFEDYTNDELKQIFINMANKNGFIVEDSALDYLNKLIDENRNIKNFGNARFIRNVYEKTIIKHATNTKKYTSKKKLITITMNDITI